MGGVQCPQPTSFSVFSPHSRPISGMVFQQRTHTSVITCSYDGSVRRMNLETNTFDEVFAEDGYSFAGVDASPTHTDAIYAATSVSHSDCQTTSGHTGRMTWCSSTTNASSRI